MRQQFLKDTADTFKTYIYENNRKLTPTSATLTVYRPGLREVLINGEAMTVAADGLLSFPLTADHNARPNGRTNMNNDYKAVVAYVHPNGGTFYATLFYDVVFTKLAKVIVDDDLIRELPQLRGKQQAVHGTATGGNGSTIVDAELKNYEDNYFAGGRATNLTTNEVRGIISFVSSSGTVNTEAFVTTVIAGHKYLLQRPFTQEIDRAFDKLENLIIQAGRRPHLIMDPYDLKEVHTLMAVAEVCKGLITDNGGMWWQLQQDYDKKAYFAFKGMNFKYDETEEGLLTPDEKGKSMTLRSGRG